MTPPTLVLLPGNMCDARLWNDLAFPAGLPKVFAPLTEESTIADMAESALSLAGRALLPVGFSMGGIVAIEMARLAPDRVRGLVLIDTTADADLPERGALRLDQQKRAAAGALRAVVRDELKPSYLAAARRQDDSLKCLLIDMAAELGPETFVRQSEALRLRGDNREALSRFEGPVFIACGAEDALISPERHRAMAETCARATLAIIEGAGHMTPLEQPGALGAALNRWIAENEEELLQ